jgi:FlaA1/EpsC-like NDP-sugar epimerase
MVLRWKSLLLAAVDAGLVNAAVIAAFLLRFDGHIPTDDLARYLVVAPLHTGLVLLALHLLKVNRSLWRYAGVPTALALLQALSLEHAAAFFVNWIWEPQPFPRSVVILSWILSFLFIGGSRLAWRLYRGGGFLSRRAHGRAVLIAGAGDVGAVVARELQRPGNPVGYPIGFVDDDPSKQGRRIENVDVLGTTFDIPRILARYRVDEIIIAAPSAPSRLIRQIYAYGSRAGIKVRTVPSLADFIEGRGALGQVREVSIEDLLGRDPVRIDQAEVAAFLGGKRVMVTGAGGSIGSELCRQIARFRPAKLVALDQNENQLTYLGVELARKEPALEVLLVVGDIRDERGIQNLMDEHRPHVVFHAAAHKHVPLLEERPREAIRNNILGTLNVARAAQRSQAEAMVLISTDKAVDPTNVMGASKRACELIIQALGQQGPTVFTAVRFGNVMGSEGSVIPIFRRQIAAGGPVTVTHPEARRYFMTVSEAAQLVLQAASLGQSGDVFILDMGEQVRILDVARQLIRLSGLEPDRDIPIVFTGLRPGEKLEEELLTDSEKVRTTRHEKVFRCKLPPVDADEILGKVERLVAAADRADPQELKAMLRDLVPEYRPGTPEALPAERVQPEEREAGERVAVAAGNRRRTPWSARLAAAGLLLATIVPAGLLLLVRKLLAPEGVRLVREVRVGRDRRRWERRRRAAVAPIDRRYRDRRQRNLGGQPYVTYRIVLKPGGPRWVRLLDRVLRALGVDLFLGLWNVVRGHARMTDLYPGQVLESEVPAEPPPVASEPRRAGSVAHHGG